MKGLGGEKLRRKMVEQLSIASEGGPNLTERDRARTNRVMWRNSCVNNSGMPDFEVGFIYRRQSIMITGFTMVTGAQAPEYCITQITCLRQI